MGLDIYLYDKATEEANDAHEKAWSAVWERVKDLPEDERRAKLDEAKASGEIPDASSHQDVAARKHPDCYSNRRYLRSSYNSSGFDSAVPDFIGVDHGFYWIFEPVRGDTEEYSFELTEGSVSALREARDRALQVAEELRGSDRLRAETLSPGHIGESEHMWKQLPSADEVLAWYREEVKRQSATYPNGGYSNAKGTVFGFEKGMEVLAATSGRFVLGGSAPVVVFREGQEVLDSYIQTAEVAAEFCEEAIDLIAQDGGAYIHWSA